LSESLWNRCLRVLESELPEQQFNTWVRPLQAIERDGQLKLLAPNRYVIEWLGQNSLPRIKELIRAFAEDPAPEVVLDVGTRAGAAAPVVAVNGGHTWPGGEQYMTEKEVGKTSHALNANETIWSFLVTKKIAGESGIEH